MLGSNSSAIEDFIQSISWAVRSCGLLRSCFGKTKAINPGGVGPAPHILTTSAPTSKSLNF